ncbi:MAG: hypothetical protein GY810_06685 [Aureispira sp.]|nr:hypothetical protein [Aureispira sp.]
MIKTLTLVFVLVVFAALVACSPNMKQYDDIVSKIKSFSIPENSTQRYRITDFGDIETLEAIADDVSFPRGQGAGTVWAHRTTNNLIVYIETKDQGHAGEFGYAYSENGERSGWPTEDFVRYWSIDKQVSENWWRVSYRLD